MTANVIPIRPQGHALTTPEDRKRTRRTFGKIRELPSGRFQASYLGADGQRHVGPVTFLSRGDAGSWLDMRHAELLEHRWKPPAPPEPETVTLADFAAKWLDTRRNRHGEPLKPRTKALYRGLLDGHILPAFGAYAVADITPDMVDDWHARLLPEAPTRRAHTYALLSSIMKTAASQRRPLIATSPCQVPFASKVARKFEPVPATPDEVRAIVDAMPDRLRLMVLLAAWVGLRYGELAELRRKDLNADAMTVHVMRGVVWLKGETVVGKPKSEAGQRVVHIPQSLKPTVVHHLAEHAQPGDEGLLFPALSGEHLNPSSLMKHYRKARAVAGRPDLRFHDLRHTAATTAAQTGATLRELMGRMGHSTTAAALAYQHIAAERDKAIAAGVDAIIAPPSPKKARKGKKK